MFNLKYQNLNFYNPIRSNVFSKSFVLSNEKYPELGSLFIVLNIGGTTNEGFKIADILQEVARLEYFKMQNHENNPVKNFENTVNKINQAFTTLAESNHIEWINKLNFSLVSLYEDQMQFVRVGNIKTFLLRENKLISLIKDDAEKSLNPQKIFSSIVSGTLQKNDKLIISTTELFDYFSQNSVKEIISKLSPRDICFKFQENLSQQANNTYPVASVFLEVSSNSPGNESIGEQNDSTALNDFPDLENFKKETGESKSLDAKNNKNNAILDKIKSYSAKLPNTITNKGKGILANFKKEKNNDIDNDPTLSKINKNNDNSIRDWQGGYSSNLSSLGSKAKDIFQGLLAKFNNLSKTSKILFIVSAVFVCAFLVSISMQATKKSSGEQNSFVNEKLSNAIEKEKMAADALIYSDSEGAKKLLFEATNILEEKVIAESQNTEIQQERNNLITRINESFDKIDKVIRVEEPVLTVNVSSDNIGENILGIEENVYTYDSLNNTIYQVEESSKKLGTISDDSTNIGYFNKGVANSTKNSLLFLTETPSVAEFDVDAGNIEEIDITFAKSDAEIADIKIYNDRLYVLDTKNNQIYKHTRTISGYSKGISWVNEGDFDISKATSFAIDGAVYILEKNGNVQKYLNGYIKDFALLQPSNPVESPTRIFTLVDYKYLYILDPSNNRLLVFDKESGELISQYISDKFTEMKDVYIDEVNKKIFLLCGDKIYGFILEEAEEM